MIHTTTRRQILQQRTVRKRTETKAQQRLGKIRYGLEKNFVTAIQQFTQSSLFRKQADYAEDNLVNFCARLDAVNTYGSLNKASQMHGQFVKAWTELIEPLAIRSSYGKPPPVKADHRKSELRANGRRA
jgi:hypothetical protein